MEVAARDLAIAISASAAHDFIQLDCMSIETGRRQLPFASARTFFTTTSIHLILKSVHDSFSNLVHFPDIILGTTASPTKV